MLVLETKLLETGTDFPWMHPGETGGMRDGIRDNSWLQSALKPYLLKTERIA